MIIGMELKTGQHYWFRQKFEKIWRVCYVGEDPDGGQWLHAIDFRLEVAKMDPAAFEFTPLDPPAR